jgi:hypothetical protein
MTNGVKPVLALCPDDVKSVTFSCKAEKFSSGDLIADTQQVSDAFREVGGRLIVQSVVIHDYDDQAGALDVVFLNAATSLGTEGDAPNITDTAGSAVLGHVPIAATDYCDLGGFQVATKAPVGLMLEATSASRSLYVAAISRSDKTYTTSGLAVTLGLMRS